MGGGGKYLSKGFQAFSLNFLPRGLRQLRGGSRCQLGGGARAVANSARRGRSEGAWLFAHDLSAVIRNVLKLRGGIARITSKLPLAEYWALVGDEAVALWDEVETLWDESEAGLGTRSHQGGGRQTFSRDSRCLFFLRLRCGRSGARSSSFAQGQLKVPALSATIGGGEQG